MGLTLTIVLAVLAVAVLAFLALAVRLTLERQGAPPLREQVLINTRAPDDLQVRGVLTELGRRWIVVESAEVLGDDGTWTRIQGAQHLPVSNVLNVSRL